MDVVPFASDLSSAIAATNACLTGDEMRMLVRRGETLKLDDPRLAAERDSAINNTESYFGVEIPWFRTAPKYCPGSPQIEKLRSLLTRMYGSASAEVAATQVQAEARAGLVEDLTTKNPLNPFNPDSWWSGGKWWLAGALVVLGLFFAWRLFGRAIT